MAEFRRGSRADRRRADGSSPVGEERRDVPPAQPVIDSTFMSGEIVIRVRNPLTADHAGYARTTLMAFADKARAPVYLDLCKTPYIDTVALSLLFELKKYVEGTGRKFFLQNPSRGVRRLLNITNMNKVFAMRITDVDTNRIPAIGSTSGDMTDID